MPRWLSEGISVYEERQANGSWGQAMNPVYREMMLKGEFHAGEPAERRVPQAGQPAAPAVRLLRVVDGGGVPVGRYGPRAMQRMLTDLGQSIPINEALARGTPGRSRSWTRTSPPGSASRPKRWPRTPIGSGRSWRPRPIPPTGPPGTRSTPTASGACSAEGQALVAERKWKEAIEPLEEAVEALSQDDGGRAVRIALLAAAHRGTGRNRGGARGAREAGRARRRRCRCRACG